MRDKVVYIQLSSACLIIRVAGFILNSAAFKYCNSKMGPADHSFILFELKYTQYCINNV